MTNWHTVMAQTQEAKKADQKFVEIFFMPACRNHTQSQQSGFIWP